MTGGLGYGHLHEDVLGGVPVGLEATTELTVPEAVVDTEVTADGGLPLQVGVGEDLTWREGHGTLVAVPGHLGYPVLFPERGVDIVVTRCTVRETQLQVVEPATCALHERLVAKTPTEGG